MLKIDNAACTAVASKKNIRPSSTGSSIFFADLRSDGKSFAVKLSPDADYKGNRGFESGSKISHGCAHLGYSSSCREAAPGDAGTTGDGDDKCSDDQLQQ